jgi:hypothetical protein
MISERDSYKEGLRKVVRRPSQGQVVVDLRSVNMVPTCFYGLLTCNVLNLTVSHPEKGACVLTQSTAAE